MEKIKKTSKINDKTFYIIAFSFAILTIFFIFSNILDSDVYYLIYQGRDILTNGFGDITIQNWLYDVIIAFIYDHFDIAGLLIFYIIQVLLLLFLIYKVMKKPFKEYIFFVIPTLVVFNYWNLRPEIITTSLILATIWCIEKGDKYLWLFPIFTLLEINLHASYFIFHFIVLLPYIVPPIIIKCKDTRPFLYLAPILTGVLALFINPYGIKNITYLFSSIGNSNLTYVTEQKSPTFLSVTGIILLISLIVFIFLYIKHKLDSVSFYMFFGFFLTSIYAEKNFIFLAIGLIFIVRNLKMPNLEMPTKISAIIYSIFVIGLFIIITIVFPKKNLDIDKFDDSSDLYDTTSYIEKDAKILSDFAENNYFKFKGYEVCYDARPELYPNLNLKFEYSITIYSDEEIEEYIKNFDYDYIVTHNCRLYEYARKNLNFVAKCGEYYVFRKESL